MLPMGSRSLRHPLLILGKVRAAFTRKGVELPTAGAKPKAFGACPEKRLCARQLVLGNRNDGNRTLTASLDGEIRDGRHQMQVRVYFEDTDSGQIVYHANFLRFMERGRTNYLRLLGANQHALLQEARNDAPGFTFVVRSMTIDFLKPAVLDDVLDVVTLPQEVRGASITLLQECRRADDLLVTARVRVAFISGGKAQRIPKALRLAMEGIDK
jgi:acyl-CoA thioester hydrolase